ncbi:MAG: hypothetical protein PHW56_10925 [Methanosarcinaceae archaeon]|nr:hypothetical protein [Methanosarcinaceae archaeon]
MIGNGDFSIQGRGFCEVQVFICVITKRPVSKLTGESSVFPSGNHQRLPESDLSRKNKALNKVEECIFSKPARGVESPASSKNRKNIFGRIWQKAF